MNAPSWVDALLAYLEDELDRVMWNLTQKEYESPFRNTGNEFKTDVFEVRAYYWGDDEEEYKKPNFKCGDVEISWYKHLGRGTYLKRKYSVKELLDAFNKSLVSILEYEKAHDKFNYVKEDDVSFEEIIGADYGD